MQAEITPSKPKQRTVQATLRRVIELGHYGADVFDDASQTYLRQHYMCCALMSAHAAGGVTEDEYTRAIEEIGAYLGEGSGSMYLRLQRAGLVPPMEHDEFADTVGRQLYWDWDKRQPLD